MREDGYQKFKKTHYLEKSKYNEFRRLQNQYKSIREYAKFTEQYEELRCSTIDREEAQRECMEPE